MDMVTLKGLQSDYVKHKINKILNVFVICGILICPLSVCSSFESCYLSVDQVKLLICFSKVNRLITVTTILKI